MAKVDWSKYPRVAGDRSARTLLEIEVSLGRSPNTIDAYARARDHFLRFCDEAGVDPERITREYLALWVRRLAEGQRQRTSSSGSLLRLSNSTIQQRLTAVRLFFDFLVESGVRGDNPVGRGRYTPGTAFGSRSERGLLPRYKKLPWIPTDDQWDALLRAASLEPLRSRLMFALAYDAALRREELCSLEISDFDFSHRLVLIRAETTKSRASRSIPYSAASASLLAAYLDRRRSMMRAPGRVFLSESSRNRGKPISIWIWSKVTNRMARFAGLPGFTTHTFRHLRLTDLARSGWDIHEIATFAGHRSIESTKDYIHLSGRELASKLRTGMSELHDWRIRTLEEHFL